MTATSQYLNREVRTMSEALRDAAMARYVERYPKGGGRHEETFELSQEFRDYRTQMRRALNGSIRG